MTRIGEERIDEMLAGLEKLPHGPWFHGVAEGQNGTAGLAQVDNGAEMWPVIAEWHEAAHIARCDPDTIRSILTELKELRAQGGVMVKGLVWRDLDNGTAWSNVTIVGMAYFVTPEGTWAHRNGSPNKVGTTIEAAKAAAEADYRTRILSALEIINE